MTNQPATPFWDGYTRPPGITDQLTEAFRQALERNPNMRAGQIIANLPINDIFQIWDEDLLEVLRTTG